MSLIKESNSQYYSGQHKVPVGTSQHIFVFPNFNTKLESAYDPLGAQVSSTSNFVLFHLTTANPLPVVGVNDIPEAQVSVLNPDKNEVRLTNNISNGELLCQLKQFAIGNNYGSYSYVSLQEVITNFMIAYVGSGKVIQKAKRSDVIFHAKRGLQEFSYDTLKSIKSQELTIPLNLSVPIPQDYVNYVKVSWIDSVGVEHIILPTKLTSNPNELPIQDSDGVPTQSIYEDNLLAAQSLTEERWKSKNSSNINNLQPDDYRFPRKDWVLGQRYGMDTENANINGTFTINERLGKFSFSSDLANKLIIFEYISDGLSSNLETKIPKMAEEAMYMHILYSIVSTRANIPEYVVQRYKKERSVALRNAKIRLSNLKLGEFVQVMRGKSKWIKH